MPPATAPLGSRLARPLLLLAVHRLALRPLLRGTLLRGRALNLLAALRPAHLLLLDRRAALDAGERRVRRSLWPRIPRSGRRTWRRWRGCLPR